MRLGPGTLARLPGFVAKPTYARDQQRMGIVHLGLGAFHRAHQAWYTDQAMDAGDRDWAISGVSMLTGEVPSQMEPQSGLYTVRERHPATEHLHLVAAIREVLTAQDQRGHVVSRLSSPDTHIVSLTITERGYCRAADGSLDTARAAASPVYTLLAEGLRRRRDAGLPGVTLLSCDNLSDNGRQLERLLGDHLQQQDAALAGWVATECSCPCTMVDRVTPAPTDEDRAELAALLGLRDEAAVVTEPFSQWVIEDRFAGPRPRWERVGAQLVADVRPHETAKLRMLNGAHSALAYLGLLRGHAYVHEAVADMFIRPLVERLMREEAIPTLADQPPAELHRYADALFARFENPALRHRLGQIAIDGSQKIPQRWLATLAACQAMERSCPALLVALAAWLLHLRGANGPVDDVLADTLQATWAAAGRDGIVHALLGRDGPLASAWTPTRADHGQIMSALRQLSGD